MRIGNLLCSTGTHTTEDLYRSCRASHLARIGFSTPTVSPTFSSAASYIVATGNSPAVNTVWPGLETRVFATR
ncbi:hypothetical protein JMJ77_0007571, partial [Colletotrichum scovillei]